MFKWIASLFVRNTKGICGGVECVDIVGRFNTDTGLKIFYNRPTADMILTYTYDYQMLIEDDSKLRQIGKQKNQHADMAKRLLEIFFIPHAKEIFHHCEGFFDSEGKPLEKRKPEEQFELIKKYHSYYLADVCALAFELTNKCKKKD